MGVFENYARYYDLLYRDKDYAAEAEFVHRLIRTYSPSGRSILELGCGTGTHAEKLASYGYEIHGVDLSEEMLQTARTKLSSLPVETQHRVQYSHGDIRTLRLQKKHDIIVSLFHVMSYQTANSDLEAAFDTVANHLVPGGIFIFDCWYGPAVITDKPSTRVKRLEDDLIRAVRIAEPVLHPEENTVDVNYQVMIEDKQTHATSQLTEKHSMRYLFRPEIESLARSRRMELLESGEWMTGKRPAYDTWCCFFVLRS